MRPIIVFLALTAAVVSLAQEPYRPDRILLMNGEIIRTRVLGQSTLEVRYQEFGKYGRVKERSEPTESVFSVTDSLGHERIWYFMDTAFGNDLNIEEMRCFLKGEQDAREGYKPRWPVWGGFVVGAGATIAANLEMNSLFLPPLYGAAMILPRVHVTKGSITDLTMEGNEHYAYGYAKVGKSKRIVRSMLSTAAGVAVGLAVRQLIINPSLPGYD